MKRISINEWAEPQVLLPRLRSLDLEDCEELDLNRNLLGPEGMRALAQMRLLRLVALELFANRIGNEGAGYLAKAPFAPNLIRLRLGGEYRYGLDNNIDDEGFARLLPKLQSIEDLDLSYNRARAATGRAFGACQALKYLNLHENRLENDGISALAETPLPLKQLNLGNNYITEEGIAAFVHSKLLHSIETLILDDNRIKDGGARHLANSNFRPLWLSLNRCGLTDAGAITLAASPILTRVKTLGLGENRIGEEGLAALIQSPYLTNLKSLCFRNNPAGPSYSPWQDWDGSVLGNDFDSEHADRIAARFGREIDIN